MAASWRGDHGISTCIKVNIPNPPTMMRLGSQTNIDPNAEGITNICLIVVARFSPRYKTTEDTISGKHKTVPLKNASKERPSRIESGNHPRQNINQTSNVENLTKTFMLSYLSLKA